MYRLLSPPPALVILRGATDFIDAKQACLNIRYGGFASCFRGGNGALESLQLKVQLDAHDTIRLSAHKWHSRPKYLVSVCVTQLKFDMICW